MRIPFLFLWLTLAAGLVILYPQIDFQGFLASGDHGRDLYAFERTLKGDVPYQDYWWVYGPFMPYYYAITEHLLGVNIMSVLVGKALLTLASGLLIFFTIEALAGGLTGFAGALWFFSFGRDFFFTYNHAGGITCICFIMFCMARYIKNRRDDWLWTGLVAAFILALIKLNFGLAMIPMLLMTASLSDHTQAIPLTARKKFFYLFSVLVLPLLIAAVYWIFLYGLTWAEIQQCMPFGRSDTVYNSSPLQAVLILINFFWKNVITNRTDFILAAMVGMSLLHFIYRLSDKEMPAEERNERLLVLGLFAACYILCLHEYIKSDLWYRTFWGQPAGIVWMFALIGLAFKNFSAVPRALGLGLLIILATFHAVTISTAINNLHTSDHYLSNPRAKVFVANTPDWIKTVEDSAAYLNKQVPSGEPFFALPYDSLYYYLTEKRSPSRMLIFFDHIHIPPEQEHQILKELTGKRTNFVLLSNRMRSQEMNLGTFGQTYCPIIAKYIDDNFVPVAQFGDWKSEPGWAWNHGTVILQRKDLRK